MRRLTIAILLSITASYAIRGQVYTDWNVNPWETVTNVEEAALKGGEYDAEGIIGDWSRVLEQFGQYRDDGSIEKEAVELEGNTQKKKLVLPGGQTLELPKLVDKDGIDLFFLTSDGIRIYMALDAPAYFEDIDDEVVRWVRFYAWKNRKWIAAVFRRYEEWADYAKGVFTRYGVPEELTELCLIESGCNPKALSRAGALGMWQIMPATGRHHGLTIDGNRDDRTDPLLATPAAARILKANYRKTGNWTLAAAAYNCGAGKIGSSVTWEAARGKLPAETQRYIPSLLAMHYVWVYRKELGF